MSTQYEVCLGALLELEEINEMLNLENMELRKKNKKLEKTKEELEITIKKYRQYVGSLEWENEEIYDGK
jgi:hypothetical protein